MRMAEPVVVTATRREYGAFTPWKATEADEPGALRRVRRFVLLFAVVSAGALVVHLLAATGRPWDVRLLAAAVSFVLSAVWILRASRPAWWGEAVLGAVALGLAAVALPAPVQALGLVFVAAIRHSLERQARAMAVAVALLVAGYLTGVLASVWRPGVTEPAMVVSEMAQAGVPLAWLVVAAFAVRLAVQAVYAESAAKSQSAWNGSRLSAVLEVSPVGLVLVDQTNRVALWNGAAERIFGWPAEQVLGLEPVPAGELTPLEPHPESQPERQSEPQSEPLCSALFRAVLERRPPDPSPGPSVRYVVDGRRCGRPVTLAVSAAPLLEPDGAPGGVLFAVSDLSEHLDPFREQPNVCGPYGQVEAG
jgi:PAS domain S-box-containing protein